MARFRQPVGLARIHGSGYGECEEEGKFRSVLNLRLHCGGAGGFPPAGELGFPGSGSVECIRGFPILRLLLLSAKFAAWLLWLSGFGSGSRAA